MFPSTISVALLIIGAIWVIQGTGLVATGSFMDGQTLWAVLGAACMTAGLVLVVLKRRRPPEG